MPQDKQSVKRIQEIGSDWIGEPQDVRLGDYNGDVLSVTPGRYLARQLNGRVIEVLNAIHVPPRFDLHVKARRSKSQPNLWQITETLEDYTDPAGAGELAYHHKQHEEGGPDRVNLSRKQIYARTVRVKNGASFIVRVYGDADFTQNGYVAIKTQDLDLSSYVISAGAKFIAIESDEDGVLSIQDGVAFGSPVVGTAEDFPVPDVGKYSRAFVLMYEGQEELLDEDITIPWPPSFNPLAFSSSAHNHDDRYPRKWTGKTTAPTATDDSDSDYAVSDLWIDETNDLAYIAIDVTVGAAVWQEIGSGDGGEEEEPGVGHVHGLMRWAGASGNTSFALPDLAAYVESLTLNGLEEDPTVYTLSAAGDTITLDTALASDTIVIAHYVLLNL